MADSLPLAVRRTRRSTAGIIKKEDVVECIIPPKTPSRRKRSVRFSEPASQCGLTPMMRRTSMLTPRSRRSATPSASSHRRCSYDNATAPPLDFSHRTIDGRVERRARRSGMRDMLLKVDTEKKHSRAEIDRLKAAVKAKDREIYEMQNATIVMDTERIWDLETQIGALKRQLHDKEEERHDWTMAARDPFADEYTNMVLDDYDDEDEHFGDATVAQLHASTPSRARSSFPTPPATSPTVPATPCSQRFTPSPKNHAGVQVHVPDQEKIHMEEELASLQLEVAKLTTSLEAYSKAHERMASELGSSDIEAQVTLMLQSAAEKTAALSDVSATIAKLGFPGEDASSMLAGVTSGFRAARLELEYLTPGEITLPLTSHGAEVLDLLLTRLRELASKATEDEASIDEYHTIEQSLRSQLSARVSAMDKLHAELSKARSLLADKDIRVGELQVGNDRLQGAVKSYARDLAELEALVESLDKDRMQHEGTLIDRDEAVAEKDQSLAEKDEKIAQLDAKMAEAVKQTTQLLHDMEDLEDEHVKRVAALNKQHGSALALRDARVMELRVEMDRLNETIRAAHENIRCLRVQNGKLSADKGKAQKAMGEMKAELQRVLDMSAGLLESPKAAKTVAAGKKRKSDEERIGSLAPKESNIKKARRPDSGLGLLEEDQVDLEV